LSSAYLPISAVLVNDRIFQGLADESHVIGTFGTGYTYSGHPVPAAVAIETLKIYDELNIVDHVREVGPHLLDGMRRRFADHPLVGEVRGVGLIGAIEMVADRETRTNFDPKLKMAARWAKHMEPHGVIGRTLFNDTVAVSPPLIITPAEVDEMLDRMAAALSDLTAELHKERLAVVG
jgi:4-aminobutyrate--pyruvate transaminase